MRTIAGMWLAATLASASLPLIQSTPRLLTRTEVGSGWQGISGGAGTDVTVLMAPPNHVLGALRLGDQNDAPCYLRAHFWSVAVVRQEATAPGGEPPPTIVALAVDSTDAFDACRPDHAASVLDVTLPPLGSRRYAADALQTCVRRGDGALGGITLWGALLGRGPTPDIGIAASAHRPDCDVPQRKVSCPVGEVITGIRIEHISDGLGRRITGLAPHCARAWAEPVTPAGSTSPR